MIQLQVDKLVPIYLLGHPHFYRVGQALPWVFCKNNITRSLVLLGIISHHSNIGLWLALTQHFLHDPGSLIPGGDWIAGARAGEAAARVGARDEGDTLHMG